MNSSSSGYGPPLIRLGAWSGPHLALFGPVWAAFAGALTVMGRAWDTGGLLPLFLALLLADPLLGGFWVAAVTPDWFGPWQQKISAMASIPRLPYILPGSPAQRLLSRLAIIIAHWRQAVWPRLGSSFLQVVFLFGASLAIAASLGPRVVLLVLASAALAILQVILKRLRGGGLTSLSAFYHFGLAWLVGYEALGGPGYDTNPGLSLALAAACLPVYYGYLALAIEQGETPRRALLTLHGGQAMALLLLLSAYRLWQAWLVGLLLVAQAMWVPKIRSDGHNVAYLRGIQPLLMAVVILSCLT